MYSPLRDDLVCNFLIGVKYWYLLPLYIPIVWQFAEILQRQPWMAVIGLTVAAAGFAFIGLLNEKFAVRFLQNARARLSDEQEL
jgi:hypothetical protein